MRARLLVFPIKGRNWCFSRPNINRLVPESDSTQNPSTLTDLWNKISSNSSKPLSSNAEILIDFASNKMNRAWIALENAPEGTIKKKIHGLGLRLLAGVKPSEIFLKSISKDISQVEITYPSSLNARLVRRRLRHIATRGTIIHRKYFYGSVTLLPLTTAFTVLPLPNIPFFWVLFRTYSHWRALQFINEISWLGNIALGIFRKALKDIQFKGLTIPAGWGVIVCPPAVHLNPAKYEDPFAFNP